jgi:hypothetical protein
MGFFTDLIINTFISDKTKKTVMLSEQMKMNKLLQEQNEQPFFNPKNNHPHYKLIQN